MLPLEATAAPTSTLELGPNGNGVMEMLPAHITLRGPAETATTPANRISIQP